MMSTPAAAAGGGLIRAAADVGRLVVLLILVIRTEGVDGEGGLFHGEQCSNVGRRERDAVVCEPPATDAVVIVVVAGAGTQSPPCLPWALWTGRVSLPHVLH